VTSDMVAFRAERKKGIGASDAYDAVFSPLKVYLDKTGQLPKESSPEMDIGLELEPFIARLYERTTGSPLHAPGVSFQRPGYPFMRANPDRYVIPSRKPVELKARGDDEGFGLAGTDEVPEQILLQVQQQMACLDADEADVAALIRLADFRVYTVRRHQELINRLTEIEGDLWERIERGDPPAPDWTHKDTPRLIALLHRPDEAIVAELDGFAALALDDYQRLGRTIGDLEKQREELKGRLIEAMGDAGQATVPDGRVIKRRVINVAAREQAAYSYTNFTISNPKRRKAT
jgi:putative phage-type endonuclease